MRKHIRLLRRFRSDTTAASAAEFALVLPLMILFFIGIIDAGYYMWQLNRAEKAVQIGARWAVATDMVPANLRNYSFAVSGGIEQGTVVPAASFPKVTCTSTSCTGQWGHSTTAFNSILNRMQEIKTGVAASNLTVEYEWSGLGYAGDPNGPDVAPIVTVKLTGLTHTPITSILFGTTNLPTFAYSLTAEDSIGAYSN